MLDIKDYQVSVSEKVKASAAYQHLVKIFPHDTLDLCIETLCGNSETVFFDELLEAKDISLAELMQVVRFQPSVYTLSTEAFCAAKILVDSRSDEKYKADYLQLKDPKKSRKKLKQLDELYNATDDLREAYDLKYGQLRTITFGAFMTTFKALHFQKIAQFASDFDEYLILLEPFKDPATLQVKYPPAIYEGLRRVTELLLNQVISDLDIPAEIETVAPSEVISLADSRKVVEGALFNFGELKIMVESPSEKLKDRLDDPEQALAHDSLNIASIRISHGTSDYQLFTVQRDGEIFSAGCGLDLNDMISDKNKLKSLKNLIFHVLKQFFLNQEIDPTLVFPDIFTEAEKAAIKTDQAVKQVVSDSPANYSVLGSVSSTYLKRKLDKLLGTPIRINGSHHVYRSRNGKTVPVPIHSGQDLGKGLLIKILTLLEISPEEIKSA